MTRTTTDLRAALQRLADDAPTVRDLESRAWGSRPDSAPARRPAWRPGFAITVAAAVLVALIAVGLTVVGSGDDETPAAGSGVQLEVRPVVAPAVPIAPSGPHTGDPLAGLTFPVPTSDAGYDRLSSEQQQQLRAALARTDCRGQGSTSAPTRVACGVGDRMALLLGRSIFGRSDLSSARPVAPSVGSGAVEWTVLVTLDTQAAARWSRYTEAHLARGTGGDVTQCDQPAGGACSAYVAFVVDGSVISVPVILARMDSTLQIAGNFTRESAAALARQLHR